MDIRKLQRAIVDGLEDVKAHNIVVFNTEHLSPLFERVIIASGTSNRQTKALASSVRDAVKSNGFPVMRTEGEENGEWIIVDCGAAVAHIMQPAIRDYYHLEEIWGSKPVRLKMGEATAASKTSTAARRAGASGAEPARAAQKAAPRAAKKAPATRAGIERTVGVKRAPAGAAAPAKAPRSAAAKGRPVRDLTPAQRAASAPRKTVARKAPAKTASPVRRASGTSAASGSRDAAPRVAARKKTAPRG